MRLYLIDRDPLMIAEWQRYFVHEDDVIVTHEAFHRFMKNDDPQCIVSPGNAFGLMDGGFDLAISEYFGPKLEAVVQEKILKDYLGEQMVGTAFLVDIPDTDKKLIYAPTMRFPSPIKDPLVIYHVMRAVLLLAKKKHIKSLAVPALGAGTGQVDCDIVAKMMYEAYDQIQNPPEHIDWVYAQARDVE